MTHPRRRVVIGADATPSAIRSDERLLHRISGRFGTKPDRKRAHEPPELAPEHLTEITCRLHETPYTRQSRTRLGADSTNP